MKQNLIKQSSSLLLKYWMWGNHERRRVLDRYELFQQHVCQDSTDTTSFRKRNVVHMLSSVGRTGLKQGSVPALCGIKKPA